MFVQRTYRTSELRPVHLSAHPTKCAPLSDEHGRLCLFISSRCKKQRSNETRHPSIRIPYKYVMVFSFILLESLAMRHPTHASPSIHTLQLRYSHPIPRRRQLPPSISLTRSREMKGSARAYVADQCIPGTNPSLTLPQPIPTKPHRSTRQQRQLSRLQYLRLHFFYFFLFPFPGEHFLRLRRRRERE